MVLCGKRHENVGVGRADDAGGAVDVIELAVREADVIGNTDQLLFGNPAADEALDEVANHCGIFDPRACFCAKVKDKLAAIDTRKEVLAKPWNESGGRKADDKKGGDE
jgi:hypothetical protein